MKDSTLLVIVLIIIGICVYNLITGSTIQKAIFGGLLGTIVLIMLLNLRSYYVVDY
jgi:hypothetical protein